MLLTAMPPSLTPVMPEGAYTAKALFTHPATNRVPAELRVLAFATQAWARGCFPLGKPVSITALELHITWESAGPRWSCCGFAGGPKMWGGASSAVPGVSAFDGAAFRGSPSAEGCCAVPAG